MRISTDLDSIDIQILKALQANARTQIGTLAELVELSPPAVTERLRKLEERGVIRGFTTRIAPNALALDITAFIQVRVDSSTHYPKFLARATEHEAIMECHAITGDASHLLKIRTQNTATLEALLGEIQRWPGVIGTRTNLVLSTHKETLGLPFAHIETIIGEGKHGRKKD
jgi:Lrp/AsnC family leucine-responsive transcriptional regulator